MRKGPVKWLLVVSLAVAMVASPLAARAQTPGRSISAAIEMATPMPYVNHQTFVHARCAWLTEGPSSQGKLGYMVELEGAEGAGNHTFRLAISPDLGSYGYAALIFYGELGTCTGGADVKQLHGYLSEMSGEIPAGSRYALIVPVYFVYSLPNYCLAPWCVACWAACLYGYPARHAFHLDIIPPGQTPSASATPAVATQSDPTVSPQEGQGDKTAKGASSTGPAPMAHTGDQSTSVRPADRAMADEDPGDEAERVVAKAEGDDNLSSSGGSLGLGTLLVVMIAAAAAGLKMKFRHRRRP